MDNLKDDVELMRLAKTVRRRSKGAVLFCRRRSQARFWEYLSLMREWFNAGNDPLLTTLGQDDIASLAAMLFDLEAAGMANFIIESSDAGPCLRIEVIEFEP
jgi:hypothetical protein